MMKRFVPEMVHADQMSVHQTRFRWQEQQQEELVLNEERNSFLGLNSEDHVLGSVWMKSSIPIMGNEWSDELGAVLVTGNGSRSHFESNSPVQQALSSAAGIGNEAAFSSAAVSGRGGGGGQTQNHNKRKAESSKVAGEKKKKMKSYEEEESRISEQNSNSTTATAAAAVDKNKGVEGCKSDNSKASEAPKTNYIHVRARRGQATDSHSLAERVRREKISERMKYLQDLVPGCNKITGKAGVLDEIINYVQSLQRQVEFLSMKLAALSPRLDLEMGNYLPKEIYQGAHFQLDPVVPMSLNHHHTESTPRRSINGTGNAAGTNSDLLLSWENHNQSFFPGFVGSGNVKMEI